MTILDLHVTLVDCEPAVWREVRVPSDVLLTDLHQVLQVAMGWEDKHPHGFGRGESYWTASARWLLEPASEEAEERGVTLEDALGEGTVLTYLYDMGDDWEHRVAVAGTAEGTTAHAELLCGQGACPPEDSGGIFGFAELVAALRRVQAGEEPDGWDADRLHHLVGDGDAHELATKLLDFDDVAVSTELESAPITELGSLRGQDEDPHFP
ncbi:plasmid pRiA4b ORF-3 family protein [Brachybacterium kimchii]|uniref:Plasmid pRiA4b ORF-3 family protein n=1 Tax=Brachybacterium kimchii TaxID=2942909 RepID=A0ABY4N2G5_9MICO|nr:plasmid pRiA4b ORF-3 family protein [Brachybacterium kimchii]UQN28755.1 plasmid pRiA4b ORF-3 family protein [Brachybacterium kimchii]